MINDKSCLGDFVETIKGHRKEQNNPDSVCDVSVYDHRDGKRGTYSGHAAAFFSNLFAVMYVGMAPLTSATAIISEEREKNTLRVLQMCNVKAVEYLLGNAIYVVCICMLGSLVIGIAGGYADVYLLHFMLLMAFGHVVSFLIGATIGVLSKNQMIATSVTVPVMMVLSFLPMLSMFNANIRKVARFIYSEQLYLLMNHLTKIKITVETGVILGGNVMVVLGVFVFAYRKKF